MRTSANLYKIKAEDYKIIKLINKGSFGQVHLVENKETHQKYAAKIIDLDSKESTKQMIDREIQIMMHVVHPTIVKFYGFTKCKTDKNESIMIVMELFDKGSLADLLEQEEKSTADIDYDDTARQKILVGIAYGMMKLHQKRVIHRDLKPGNILIDKNFEPHITDFGLSKIYKCGQSSNMSSNTPCGTLIYMAPEVSKGLGYNGKVDVYAFGIIMYQVLCGKLTIQNFPGKMNQYIFNKKVIEENFRPKFDGLNIKPSFRKLIEKCWSDNPRDRPSFAEIFAKLAYNQCDTNTLIDDDEDDENNFYLDNVCVDQLFCYIDQITENSDLYDDLEDIRETVQFHQNSLKELKNDGMTKQMQEIQEKLSKQDEIINDCAKKIQVQEDKIKTHETKITRQQQIIKNLNAKVIGQQKLIDDQKKLIDVQQKQIESQQKKIDDQQKEIQKLKENDSEKKKVVRINPNTKNTTENNSQKTNNTEIARIWFYFFIQL